MPDDDSGGRDVPQSVYRRVVAAISAPTRVNNLRPTAEARSIRVRGGIDGQAQAGTGIVGWEGESASGTGPYGSVQKC